MDFSIADQLPERLAQFGGQLIATNPQGRELLVTYAFGDLVTVEPVLAVTQRFLDHCLDGLLLRLREARTASRLAGRSSWRTGLATQDSLGKVHNAHRGNNRPDIAVLFDAGYEVLHA